MTKKILVIDDDLNQRQMIKHILKQRQISEMVIESADGADAMRKIKNQDFDLIICDNYMPKRNGLDMINELISVHRYDPNKFIFMSGDLDDEEVKDLVKLGVRSVLVKPLFVNRFIDQIQAKFNIG